MGEGKLMRIGELAKRAGTTLRTIRYYEELGLITHTVRTKGGFRLYAEDELQKLHLIKDLQLLDLPLSQIREIFAKRREARTGSEMAPPAQTVLRQQLGEVEARIARYQAIQKALQEAMEILDCCVACGLHPGKEVCGKCPVIKGREEVPVPIHALIAVS